MEKNAANDIEYLLAVADIHKDHLASIRHWSNVKVATEGATIWASGLDLAQVRSIQVRSMPYKQLFYQQQEKLFPLNSQLPCRTAPALLWTPIDRAIPITLPSFNHNYFGMDERIPIDLVPAAQEHEAVAMMTGIDDLERYMISAPAIRMTTISWSILNHDKVFLVGTPLLPIDGDVLWNRGEALLPAGYDLQYHALADAVTTQLCPERDAWVVWRTDGTYFLIGKDDLRPLSRGSFRASIKQLSR